MTKLKNKAIKETPFPLISALIIVLFTVAVVLVDMCFLPRTAVAQETADSQRQGYDFFVGEWDCMWKSINPKTNTVASEFKCEWLVTKSLKGLMLEDDFLLYNENEQLIFAGRTLRTYFQGEKNWQHVFLPAASKASWAPFTGVWNGEQMHITASGTNERGHFKSRVKFYDIQNTSFEWMSEKSYDDGKTWLIDSQISASRKQK